MITNTKTRRVSPVGEVISSRRQRLHLAAAMILMLVGMLVPQGAWADSSGLDEAFVGDKSYYVLRSSADWDKFRQLVIEANGESDVNAIMDADISTGNSCGDTNFPYCGTFNGNGHTLNVGVDASGEQAPFKVVKNATIRDLRVTGSVKGTSYTGGLIGRILYSGHPTVHVERVWVSANVTSTGWMVSGLIGHASEGIVYMSDSRYDGYLTGNDYKSATVYGDGYSAHFHRVYEHATANSGGHFGFSYWWNGSCNAWGHGDNSTSLYSYHSWGEMADGCKSITNRNDVVNKMNAEKANTWHIVDSKAVPVMQIYPSASDVSLETYDIIPGTESGEEGMLKIPFSCDQAVKYLDVTYTNENGQTKTIHMDCKANTYAGFILVPATEQHKGLTIKAKLLVGTVTKTVKDEKDAVLHNPRKLSAQLLDYSTTKKLEDAGVVELKWEVDAPKHTDAIESDQFTVMRSLTGSDDDMESIGSVPFESGTASYTFRDETLMSALTAAQLDGNTAVPQVKYRVVRAATLQLWGFSNTTASAQTTSTLPMLHLLRVKDYQTAWADQTARTVKVTWQYAEEAGAVWDDRAKMNIVVSSTNREGAAVDVTSHTLTTDEMTVCEKVIQLDRSCVDYKIVLDVDRSESVLSVEAPYFEIRTAEDWNTFCTMVENAGGKSNVNASLMADISVTNMVGTDSSKPFQGTFEGNGHTLTVNINKNVQCVAPFRYVGNAIIRNLHTAGSVTTNDKFAAGLVSRVSDDHHLLIEGCHVSVDVSSSINGDATNGGIVGILRERASVVFLNCVFDGTFEGASCHSNGGFIGNINTDGEAIIQNSLFAPKDIKTLLTNCDTWARHGSGGKLTLTNSYSTKEYKTATSASEFPGYFVINSSADWNTFCNMVQQAQGYYDVNAVLTADISVTQQVGSDSYRYRGTFDGNGHTININLNTDDYGAVFKKASYCTIKNLHVTGNITCSNSDSDAGGIIGSVSYQGFTADIINCRVSATIKGFFVGGIVGAAISSKITLTNCLFDGNLVGYNSDSHGSAFVGRRGSDDALPTLNNCLDHGTYQGFKLKGLSDTKAPAGSNNWSYNGLTGATAVGSLSASDLAAKLGSGWTVANGNAVPVIQPKAASGNVAGKTADEIVALLGSGWQKDASGNPIPKMANNAQQAIPNSVKHPFNIHSSEDWLAFCKLVTEAKGQQDIYAQLLADITVTKVAAFYAAEAFRGTFDGNGYTITLNISDNSNNTGLFSHVTTATLRNLNVNGSIKGINYTAALVGCVDGGATFVTENCHVSASIINNSQYAGGLIGQTQGAKTTIRNCLFDGSITAKSGSYAGSFIGWANDNSTVEYCLENGTYTGFAHAGANYRNSGQAFGGKTNYTYKDWYEISKVGTKTAAELVKALGSQWWQLDAAGRPVPKTVGGVIDGMPTFYYENMGHIDQNSLKIVTRPTSTVLTWANQTEEPVDYYEVWRKEKGESSYGNSPLVTQLTDMQYEDKQTSPVYQYIYKVRGVTSCEGLHYDETKEVEGMCEQYGTVEGRLCFLDGTGIPGESIFVTVDSIERQAVTDESGFFRFTDLPYKDKKETYYTLTSSAGAKDVTITLGTDPGKNVVKNVVMEVATSIKISGYVQYDGTSIPVQGVSFKVNDHDVRNAAGLVTTDHEGKFSFRILKGDTKIQAVKDDHKFWRDGFYHLNDDDPDTLKTYDFQTDKAGLMFYDKTRVKMIGRIVGGKTQGELPLGYALSHNNLGDSLKMVLTLEGDNASRLVFDIQDRTLKERDEVFLHEKANAKDKQFVHQTKVHTTLNRKVVYPDVHTGEYEVMLPPVKWKIQQITASGYATLFQDGQIGDVIDLSDSLTEHKITKKGEWETASYKVTDPVEEYYALYNRIYHSPVRIEYRQQGFDDFDYFGEHYYSFANLGGAKEKLALAYGVRKQGWPEGKRDSMETHYTFGYPVFNIDRKYGFTISAIEKYYYNNNTKSDTIDVVHLEGGVVTIHNGMVSATHRDTVHLDSIGQANYTIEAAQTPYLLTGDDALSTVSMSLEMDGTHYEAEPLKAYVLNVKPKTGAPEILSFSTPQLLDILRDPPGGSSKATISKGSTMKYAYTMDMSWQMGVDINLGLGTGLNTFTGLVAAPMGAGGVGGFNNGTASTYGTTIDLVWSGSGQRAFSYTMTFNEDVSTSSEKGMVGADADLYMGVVDNVVLKPATAIRAIPDSTFRQSAAILESGRMVEIAQGKDNNNKTLHLVRDEVVTYGMSFESNFIHSQKYIITELLPSLEKQCLSMIFTGTKKEAQTRADSIGRPVYLSTVTKDHEEFGFAHEMIMPKGQSATNVVDSVNFYYTIMTEWMKMIGRNEQEKLEAKDLVKNISMDGGGSLTYGESFTTDYSYVQSDKSPFQGASLSFYDEGDSKNTGYAILAVAGPILSKLIGSLANGSLGKTKGDKMANKTEVKIDAVGVSFKFGLTPVFSYDITAKNTQQTTYSRKESFTIGMDKKSHLDFDVYRVSNASDGLSGRGVNDVFLNNAFYTQAAANKKYLERDLKLENYVTPHSFVYRTIAGATLRPYEGERKTQLYKTGTILDERTKKVEKPQIKMDKQSISGVPFGEPARFKLYLTNESEQPEAVYNYFDLYQVDMKNPDGARLMIDGMPLTGTARTIEVRPGQVTEKTLEVYAGEKFDYEGLTIGLISQGDVNVYHEVAFDVHFLQTAGDIAISSPGDKWIMNCDAPIDGKKGWYLPVVISGFDKNQHNFDHIEFQYKETTRGDDYWTNLCGYYADSTIYRAATGTKEMIPENGNITTRFFGEGTVMEKGYDLRAVLFCRNGNAFLTNESKVLSGVKDTRRPQLFGTPEPKSGVLGPGDNIIFDFSEDIEYNYLQATTNFEVVGETNETAVQEAPSLQFGGNGYAQTQSRRNFANKDVTLEVMIKPEDTSNDMPLFSHGSEGKSLQLWFTKERRLKAVVNNGSDTIVAVSDSVLQFTGFQRVAMVLDNENKRLMLYGKQQVGSKDNVVYSGTGQLTFGAAEDATDGKEKFFKGRMLQGRLWYRAMDLATLNRYSGRLLTGYEMGLADYYPMNDGRGTYASDQAQGAHLILEGASWAQPEGMSLKIDNDTTGIGSNSNIFQIKTDEDWNTFRSMVEAAKGQYDVNAQLMADINITEPVGIGSARFRGDFNGNGHTLTCNIGSHGNCTAPIQYVTGISTIRNVNVSGSITGSRHSSGLVGHVESGSNVVVTNCRVSSKITVYVRGGGIVGYADAGTLTVRNCRFDGSVHHTGYDLEKDNSAASFAGAFVGCATSNTTLAVANCLDYGGYFDFYGRYSSCYINKTRWAGTNNWTRNPKVAQVINNVGNMSAEELKNALGSGWIVDASGDVVPRVNNNQVYMASKPKGLELRNDLFQRDAEQDYTLMFWFKTAKQNGTLLANGSGKADDEGALHKFFIGFEDHVLKYRTNGREFTLGDDLCNDAWHHYAMTVNRARNVASIYIDNEAKAQLTTDSLGGMLGTRFMLGDMVWQEEGNPLVYEANAFTGHIDGLMLFEQALPTTLIRRYSTKSPGGEERGLIAHMPFDHQVRQKSGELALQPWAMSTRVKRDNDGIDTGKRDSVFVDSVDKILSLIDRTMGAPVQPYEHLRNLKFSYVGRNNQLLVNIDEQDSRINKQNVYVTLYDIPDKNGNFMASPTTESFYVNRNPLTWMTLGKHRVVTIKEGQGLTLVGIIENNGGKAHTYTIENLPRWITVDKTSDIVDAQTTDEVHFTISPDLEVGTYDQMIYLVDEDGMSDAYYLELTVEGAAPDWTVAPEMKRYSMNIVAQVFVNDDLVTDSRDIVGAFDGTGRCMGVNNIEYDPATGRSMLYMTVYDSTTVANQLTFRLWHYATGKTMKLTPTEFINFGDQAIVGTVDKPVGLYSEEEYLQKLDLAQGWNWVSFNVYNQAFASVESILSRFPWQEGDILTEDSEDLTLTYRNGQWMSNSNTDISRIKLSQQYSYRVKVGKAQQIEIWGSAYKRTKERTMTVKPGWNSIGYTPMVSLPVKTALTDYFDEAMPGDVVKNQHTFAMFTADGKGGGEWLGTLKYMKPGEGYMLHRQGTTEAQFCYPYYEPGTTFIENSVNKAPQLGSNFSTTMSVVAEAVGVDVEEGDRLVAYAGGEAVGSVECSVQSVEFATAAGTPLFFLSIEGDIKAPLSFAIERGDNLIAVTGEVMKYEPDGISGSPEMPTQISFVTADQLPQHGWYTVQGIKLPKAPTQSGVYIYNGKKQVIK